MATRKLIVDGKEVEAEETLTLLQACEQAGAEIPRFWNRWKARRASRA